MRIKEVARLLAADEQDVPWRKWGPYLSERQWDTVREDYSADGNARDYFSHDQARSRAYRWGEDGLGGISDDHQLLCFALALWNGWDPILKERLFGLANSAVVLEPQVSDGSGSLFPVQQAVVTNRDPGIVVKLGEGGELMSTRVVEFCAL